MSSTTFTLDVEDVFFSLFEQHRIHEVLGKIEPYADFDRDVYEATIGEVYKLARDVVAPINAKGDQQGCRLDDNHNVITPEGYKAAWDEFKAGGWIAPRADPELGGAGMPTPIAALIQEAISGASLAFMMYPGLTAAAARVIHGFGPERFRDKVAKKLFAGEWGGTMCLTESGAGSAVGDNRARATKTDVEGVFELEGEKIYITGGDSDLVDNICHLVLARTDDAPNGIKGLSLFLVPKYEFDEDTLELGERNGAHVLRLEHKMGINASATCVLGLGTNGTCKGYLVGEERNGIAVMFHMMNEARIGVGVQGLAAGAVAFQYARHYAKERIQGTSAKDIKNADAKRVAIVEHPDVRRMLMSQKVLVETMRSMCYRLALDFDVSEHSDDEAVRQKLGGRVDLLVPIFKSICTDIGFDVAVTGVQIFGGYGYTNEYPVEQVVRDAKIQSIYEGTNGIQALDLLGRKMRIGGGKLFMDWMQEMQLELKAAKEEGFEEQATALDKGIQSLAACAMHLASTGQDNLDAALLQATPFLNCFGRIVLGMEALDQARVAKKIMADKGESAFLKGKQLNLEFFLSTFLPQAIALSKTIRSGDNSALDEALFQ